MAPPKTQNHAEARRLLKLGFKVCELHQLSKRPVGVGWQLKEVPEINDAAGGYGLLLAANGLGSIDPDNLEPAREGLRRCGFDLEELMEAGVRTSSTRPGSGGRSTFKVPPDLRRVPFASKKKHGTILELRAGGTNLQDSLPGTRYRVKDGPDIYEQDYANGKTLDHAPDLPPKFLAWWQRLDQDLDFRREQQVLLCGPDAQQSISVGEGSGTKLAYRSRMRRVFNRAYRVEDLLGMYGYSKFQGRWAPPTATGAPGVRHIPGTDDLWHSDHASDPLCGTFDAWAANVQLTCEGSLERAELAFEEEFNERRLAECVAQFSVLPLVGGDARKDPAVAPSGGAAGTGTPDQIAQRVMTGLTRTRQGDIEGTMANLKAVLDCSELTGVRLGFDTFREELMLQKVSDHTASWVPFSDTDYSAIRAGLESKIGLKKVTKEIIRDAVRWVGVLNKFDTGKNWISSLIWDDTRRIERFFIDYFGADDTPYVRACGRYLWTALAGRLLDPGCQADMVPVLVGPQGSGKSRGVAAIAPGPDLFVEVTLDARDADFARKLRGKVIGEISELRGLSTRDLESIKALVTRRREQWIPKYMEYSTSFDRRIVMVGTTNSDEFLSDPTGERRWLPIEIVRGDVDAITRDCLQLWAEAALMWDTVGVDWREAQTLAPTVQSDYLIEDTWKPLVVRWLESPASEFDDWTNGELAGLTNAQRPFHVNDVIQGALALAGTREHLRVSRREAMRIASILSQLGYVKVRPRIAGAKVRLWANKALCEQVGGRWCLKGEAK